MPKKQQVNGELYAIHPAAMIMPAMTDAEYAELKADIEANGQLERVSFFAGKLLDGRHRARVCEELRIECDAFEWEDDIDPVQTVLSLNLKRRHLDTSQRAMIAAKMANMKRGRPEKTNGQNCPLKTDDAATALNVSPKSVKNAKQVLDSGNNELIEQVEQGKTTVSAAANKLRGKTNKRPKKQNDEPKPTEAEEVYEDVPDDDEPTAMEMIEFVRSFKAFWSRCSMDQREMLVELVSELNAEPFVQSARIYKS